jgi:RNA polymerase sigma factor (sigma-70 family)
MAAAEEMDLDLVVRARQGDREAFALIVADTIRGLDRTAHLIVRDRERAQDAVQEALVRAWRDLPSLRDPDRFTAWLRRLLIRACMDELRQMHRRVVEIELTPGNQSAIADSAGAVDDRDALRRGFRRLDPDQRSLVVLHYYVGLPLAEAADALDVPIGTAKSRLHRARATLRAALDADARLDRTSWEGHPA